MSLFILEQDFKLSPPKQRIGGVFGELEPWLISDLTKFHQGDVVFVVRDEARLNALYETLSYLCPESLILKFPAWDCLPYDRVSPRRDIVATRVATLAMLSQRQPHSQRPCIVLTTPSALTQRVPPKNTMNFGTLDLKVGTGIDLEAVITYLSEHGYLRVSSVHEPGEFAIRGGILDIFPANQEYPYRLDLFGDEIESIRLFDPLSQRSDQAVQTVRLSATGEVNLNPKTIERFRTKYRELFPENLKADLLYQDISEGRTHAGMEHWLPLFYDQLETVFDYLDRPLVCMSHGTAEALTHRFELIQDHYQNRIEGQALKLEGSLRYNPLPPHYLYLTVQDLETLNRVQCDPFKTEGGINIDVQPLSSTLLNQKQRIPALKEALQGLGKGGHEVHLALGSKGQGYQILEQLQSQGFLKIQRVASWHEAEQLPKKLVRLHTLDLNQGFQTSKATFITEREIFGEKKKKVPKKSKRADLFIAEASALSVGDYIVHEDHGIGQFDGLHTLAVNGHSHDCLKLVYEGGDKLFLPVENIDLISRYGGESSQAALDRLGAAAWQARKAKVKKRLEEIANHLIEVAAARAIRMAKRFTLDPGLYAEFTDRFAFTETEDQQRTIEDVITDLGSGRPMDRLVCGDVGFGKTEVALRAAFIVAHEGQQVALIAPTTLLARQHYANFQKRFQGMPVRVEQLSRLVVGKQASDIKTDLAQGKIDIIIGTHALLAESIAFKDLGLVIVDEEQHFGVKQKERLKALQKDIHILTLTATPIPRTLQMALTGVRDLSIIATPPIDRLAVRTFITPFDPVTVKEAISRELNRSGQLFYVCPRVKDLQDVLDKLVKIDPNLRIAVAHGQMPARQLEQVMDDFADHKYDLLLSTNIIESGIDLPTVNTIFIHRADLFGLAQLYQLRGRIGRGKLRAYAYLTYPAGQVLAKNALRRLEVMQTLDTLGAGFQLASHDMDIRGAGNLLGEEQSGHVREVGVELYQQMLEDAVVKARQAQNQAQEREKDRKAVDHWSPQLNLGVSVLIPETYVQDLAIRLELYRRLASLESDAEIEDLGQELIDRFGPYPEEVKNLLKVMTLKALARRAGIDKVDIGEKGVVFRFYKNQVQAPEKVLHYIQAQKGLAKLRPDQTIFFTRYWPSAAARFEGCAVLLQEIINLLDGS